MNYVLLINREVGLGHDIYPVCGKSTKCYGQATKDPSRGGVVFKMSIDDYERDKWDILGNRDFQQIWVPEFVADEPAITALRQIFGDTPVIGSATPALVEPNLDAMKWKELTALGQRMGVYKVGQKRSLLAELIRDQLREKREAA